MKMIIETDLYIWIRFTSLLIHNFISHPTFSVQKYNFPSTLSNSDRSKTLKALEQIFYGNFVNNIIMSTFLFLTRQAL